MKLLRYWLADIKIAGEFPDTYLVCADSYLEAEQEVQNRLKSELGLDEHSYIILDIEERA